MQCNISYIVPELYFDISRDMDCREALRFIQRGIELGAYPYNYFKDVKIEKTPKILFSERYPYLSHKQMICLLERSIDPITRVTDTFCKNSCLDKVEKIVFKDKDAAIFKKPDE